MNKMKINDKTLLRICYWAGAITDGIVAIIMIFPSLRAIVFDDLVDNPPYNMAMGIAAALVMAWTFLLIWADRKPFERRGVLILTLFVIIAILGAQLYGIKNSIVSIESFTPIWIHLFVLFTLYLYPWIRTRPKK